MYGRFLFEFAIFVGAPRFLLELAILVLNEVRLVVARFHFNDTTHHNLLNLKEFLFCQRSHLDNGFYLISRVWKIPEVTLK